MLKKHEKVIKQTEMGLSDIPNEGEIKHIDELENKQENDDLGGENEFNN